MVFIVFCASAAFGMVYSWVDSKGIRHYANKEFDIPERYRARVKALYPEQSDTRSVPQNVQDQQKTVVVPVIVQPENPPQPAAVQTPAVTSVNVNIERPAAGKWRTRRANGQSD